MSLDLYNQACKLSDQDAVDFTRKAILFDKSDINKLVYDHKEKLDHYCAKAIMFLILRDIHHDVVSEVEILGVGRSDLYDITTKVIYEFETSGSKSYQRKMNEIYEQTGIEVIVVDVTILPTDIFQRYMLLQEYVRPD